jgi:tRNA A-37 threonylcarbamoyl transferase component Bud32
MVQELDENGVIAALRRLGLCGLTEQPVCTRLTGGVSSDIWRVDVVPEPVCVKRALAKLNVAAEWRAPIERNVYEAAWMAEVGAILPAAVPRLLGTDPAAGLLVMAYLPPARYRLWRTLLQAGEAEPAVAGLVGTLLARIHAATADWPDLAGRFPTDAIFHAIRLEPYLLATARRHPDLAPALAGLAERTAATKFALVHGDVSPKNLLIGPEGPVFLDAECAWYGDPAFDLAFCLNHLLLKCLWTPAATAAFLACFGAMAERYLAGVAWEPPVALEARAATLLPGLLLARVDGKSPVDYLTPAAQAVARSFARRLLAEPVPTLAELAAQWRLALPVALIGP